MSNVEELEALCLALVADKEELEGRIPTTGGSGGGGGGGGGGGRLPKAEAAVCHVRSGQR